MISRVMAEDDSVKLEASSRSNEKSETPLRLRRSVHDNDEHLSLPKTAQEATPPVKVTEMEETPASRPHFGLTLLDPVREEPTQRPSLSQPPSTSRYASPQ